MHHSLEKVLAMQFHTARKISSSQIERNHSNKLEIAFPYSTMGEAVSDFLSVIVSFLLGILIPIAVLFVYAFLADGSVYQVFEQTYNDPVLRKHLIFIAMATGYAFVFFRVKELASAGGFDWKARISLNFDCSPKTLLTWSLGTYCVLQLLSWLISDISGKSDFLPVESSGSNLLPAIGILASPFIEEILFRGILFQKVWSALSRYLPRFLAVSTALILSSVVFGFFSNNFTLSFAMGIVLTTAYLFSGNLLVPMFASMIYVLPRALELLFSA